MSKSFVKSKSHKQIYGSAHIKTSNPVVKMKGRIGCDEIQMSDIWDGTISFCIYVALYMWPVICAKSFINWSRLYNVAKVILLKFNLLRPGDVFVHQWIGSYWVRQWPVAEHYLKPCRHIVNYLTRNTVHPVKSLSEFKLFRRRKYFRKCIMQIVCHFDVPSHRHCTDVIMNVMASQILLVCSAVCLGTDQRKHQSSASLAFVRGIHRWPVNSPHKGPVTQKMFPFDDIIIVDELVSLQNDVVYSSRHRQLTEKCGSIFQMYFPHLSYELISWEAPFNKS